MSRVVSRESVDTPSSDAILKKQDTILDLVYA